jgi:hypothetical protein
MTIAARMRFRGGRLIVDDAQGNVPLLSLSLAEN